ncbi:MAG: hypothetical protein J6W10_02500, partial [Kiritimatiellae bacterium]|nr:hypothetical protein [Kiritimatiellia bacterium]
HSPEAPAGDCFIGKTKGAVTHYRFNDFSAVRAINVFNVHGGIIARISGKRNGEFDGRRGGLV